MNKNKQYAIVGIIVAILFSMIVSSWIYDYKEVKKQEKYQQKLKEFFKWRDQEAKRNKKVQQERDRENDMYFGVFKAIRDYDLKRLEEIIEKGNIDEKLLREGGCSPLGYAFTCDYMAAVKMLISNNILYYEEKYDKDGERFLSRIMDNSIEIYDLLFSKGIVEQVLGKDDIDKRLLAKAIERNRIDFIEKVLEQKKYVNSMVEGYFYFASEEDGCAGETKIRTTPLIGAILCNNKEIILLLIEHGADVNLTVIKEQENKIKWQFRLGCGVGQEGETPLMYAIEVGNPDIINLLLSKGAHIDEKTNDHRTPLFFAVVEGNDELVAYLLNKGVNVNIGIQGDQLRWDHDLLFSTVETGFTIFIASLYAEKRSIIELLVTNGADLNYETKQGYTPLMYLVTRDWKNENEQIETITYLVHKGADINYKSRMGKTALSEAEKKGNEKIIELVKSLGAHE